VDLLLRRVGPTSWAVPGTDLTLEYCPVNCWFVAYRGGQGLLTAHTLAEAEEALQAALNTQGRA
jgi:hypothetical protein